MTVAKNRRGFTLVEMLVAMGILIVLSALTFTMVNVTMDKDRISAASREIQACLEGSRNQAREAVNMRGVRFMLDPSDRTTVTSLLYIGPPNHFDSLAISVTNGSDIVGIPANLQPAWKQFRERGMLIDGATIRIPKEHGNWYTIAQDGIDNWRLTKKYNGPTETTSYLLALEPVILPFQQPKTLPRGVAIDLDNSKLPKRWIVSPGVYSDHIDVQFAPLGDVYGSFGESGKIHFVLSDISDTTINCPLPSRIAAWSSGAAHNVGSWIVSTASTGYQYLCTTAGNSGAAEPVEFSNPKPGATVTDGTAAWLCHARKPSVIVSLTTRTGNVASYPVHESDPFLYAETGETAR